MKRNLFGRVYSFATSNTKLVAYSNRRDGIIKNGGCSVLFKGKRIAFLYAIVDSYGAIVNVLQEGVLASFFKEDMEQFLKEHLITEESKSEHPRDLYFNLIDTPLR